MNVVINGRRCGEKRGQVGSRSVLNQSRIEDFIAELVVRCKPHLDLRT